MCLIVKNKWHKNGKPLIAKEDIVVFKLLSKFKNQVFTPFRFHPVNFRNGECQMKSTLRREKSKYGYICKHGIHAFLDKPYKMILTSRNFVVKAIIPKGAYYFIGNKYDIVANKMIITNEICLKGPTQL